MRGEGGGAAGWAEMVGCGCCSFWGDGGEGLGEVKPGGQRGPGRCLSGIKGGAWVRLRPSPHPPDQGGRQKAVGCAARKVRRPTDSGSQPRCHPLAYCPEALAHKKLGRGGFWEGKWFRKTRERNGIGSPADVPPPRARWEDDRTAENRPTFL